MPIVEEDYETIDSDGLPESHPVREFERYWRSLCRNGDVPDSRDIDPKAVASALPWLFFFEREPVGTDTAPEQADYVIALHGSELAQSAARRWSGKTLREEFSGHALQRRFEEIEAAHRTATPLFCRTKIRSGPNSGDWVRGIFPLASPEKRRVTAVVVVPDFDLYAKPDS